MAGVDFLEEYTEYTKIEYDKELGGLIFQIYSKIRGQVVTIRVECKKRQVNKKFVNETLEKLREAINS